jgi:hypothetical protein
MTGPLLTVARSSEPPTLARPAGLAKVASLIWPSSSMPVPSDFTPLTLPSGAMVNDSYSPFGGTVIGSSSMPSTRPPAGVVSWPRASRLKLPARV